MIDLPSGGGPNVKSGLHTLTLRDNRERAVQTLMDAESRIHLNFVKKSIFNEHPVTDKATMCSKMYKTSLLVSIKSLNFSSQPSTLRQ